MPLFTKHDAGIGSIIADRVEHLAGFTRLRVNADNPRVEDFDGWHHIISGGQHIFVGHVSATQWGLEHKCNFGFDPWLNEPTLRNGCTRFEHHVIKQNPAVGDINIQCVLHGF